MAKHPDYDYCVCGMPRWLHDVRDDQDSLCTHFELDHEFDYDEFLRLDAFRRGLFPAPR